MEELEKFQNWLSTINNPVALDDKTKEILVGVDGIWQNAIEIYKKNN